MPSRCNVLYLHSHDTGSWISPYGFAVDTPRLQQMAQEGVCFRQAFAASPTCSPSRAALLTGQSAHSCGMLGLCNMGWKLRDSSQHIADFLRRHAYTTALAGFQHVADFNNPGEVGYEQYLGDTRVAETVAVDFLKATPREPFFLDVGFFETHRWMNRAEWPFNEGGAIGDARHRHAPAPLPDVPVVRKDIADFAVSAQTLDRKIGIVLDALESSGLAENTLVIYTTDHGPPFPAMKCNLSDGGMRVGLIMRGPDGFAGGRETDALVSHIDIYPTICELLSIDRPAWCEGKSLMPLVSGIDAPLNQAIFSEINYHVDPEPQRAIRTSRWKYIRRFGPAKRSVANCDPSPSKDFMLGLGWGDLPLPSEQLFDLMFDPTENNNLIDRVEHAGILSDLRTQLDGWMRKTNDPLLAGELPKPTGQCQPFKQ